MATMAAEELATMSKEEQFEVLGVDDPEKLALGIDPDEVLEFIGTYVCVFEYTYSLLFDDVHLNLTFHFSPLYSKSTHTYILDTCTKTITQTM